MFVTFYNRAVKTNKLDEAGLPFYENKVFVIIARDHTNQVNREADQDDFDRFPETYAAFIKAHSKVEQHEGLPIEMWSPASPSDIENLKVHGFFTVQQLAKTTPQVRKTMPPHIAVLVDLAKKYIAVAGDANKTSQHISEMMDEIVSLRDENQTLKRLLAEKSAKEKDEAA